MNTGRPVPTDWLGTGENVRGKDMTSLHQPAETFVGAMVLDGVFERHRTLRGGVIELGAGWVPQMIKRLDWIAEIWSKSDPQLQGAHAQAVAADHRAHGVHAVRVRRRRRPHPPVRQPLVSVLQRLSARRRRTSAAGAIQRIARGVRRSCAVALLLGKFCAHVRHRVVHSCSPRARRGCPIGSIPADAAEFVSARLLRPKVASSTRFLAVHRHRGDCDRRVDFLQEHRGELL